MFHLLFIFALVYFLFVVLFLFFLFHPFLFKICSIFYSFSILVYFLLVSNEIWKSIYIYIYMYICTSVWICFFFFLLSCKICFLFIFALVYSLFVVLFLFTLFHSFLFKVCSIFYSFRTRFGKVFTCEHWFGFVSSSFFSSFFSLPSPLRFVLSSFASSPLKFVLFSFHFVSYLYSLFILNKIWKNIYIDLNLFLFFLFSLFHSLLFKVCSIFYSFSPSSIFYL